MLKRIATAALALALLLSTFAFGSSSAFAQRSSTAVPGVWLSAILIQNTSTASADVSINFFDSAGALQKTYTPAALAAGKSLTIVVPQAIPTLAAGQYSAVVSSTQKVIASVQTSSVSQATGPWTAFAYEGVDSTSAATKLFFPAEFNNYYGFYSELVIQNTSDTDSTNLSVSFYKADGTQIGTAVSLGALPKNSAKTFATSDAVFASAGLPTGASGLFGAVVTSSATAIAGITNVWAAGTATSAAKTASYNAFTTGSTTLYAPNLMNSYYGFGSALSIQNIDQTNRAAGTITYSNGSSETFDLAPNAAATFLQFKRTNITLPTGTAGSFSAKAVATTGSIVGIVGFSLPPELNGNVAKGDYAYYNCPSVAAPSVNIPNILSNYYGLFTGVSVQNTGTLATDITLTYEGGQTWTITGVQPNGVANFLHLPSIAKNPLGANSSVSAVASSSNAQGLVAVIQHNTERSLAGYSAAKQPSDFLHVFTATPKL
ncbi:MAG: hypothetical protein WCJ55_06395 [Chloroflexales bacterium]